MVFGDGAFSSTSKGHAGGPVKTFRNRVESIALDEFRTSKLCSCCFQPLLTPSQFNEAVAKQDRSSKTKEKQKESKSEKMEDESHESRSESARKLVFSDDPKKDYRYRVRACLRCAHENQSARVWNRDVNAAHNMLQLFVYAQCTNGQRRSEFQRNEKEAPKQTQAAPKLVACPTTCLLTSRSG